MTDLGSGRRRGIAARGAPQLPDVAELRVRPRDPAGEVVVQALRTALSRIANHEPEARRGEPEGVHRLRSASRRLRSELRALQNLVDERWRDDLEIELKWLAGVLGDVRDLDILLARVRAGVREAERPGAERLAFSPVLKALERRRARAARTMSEVLESERYRALLGASSMPERGLRLKMPQVRRVLLRCRRPRRPRGGDSRKRPVICAQTTPTKTSMKPANVPRVLDTLLN